MVPVLAPPLLLPYGVHMGTKQPLTVTAAVGRVVDYRLREERISITEASSKLGMGRDTFKRRIEGLSGFTVAELEAVANLIHSTVLEITQQAEALTKTEAVA